MFAQGDAASKPQGIGVQGLLHCLQQNGEQSAELVERLHVEPLVTVEHARIEPAQWFVPDLERGAWLGTPWPLVLCCCGAHRDRVAVVRPVFAYSVTTRDPDTTPGQVEGRKLVE